MHHGERRLAGALPAVDAAAGLPVGAVPAAGCSGAYMCLRATGGMYQLSRDLEYTGVIASKQASISTPPSMGHVPRTVTLEYSSAGGISGSVRL